MSTIPPADDRLSRAEAALRRAPIPDGPSELTVSRTLAALNAKTSSRDNPHSRRKTMTAALKIAAAVLVAGGGVLYIALAPPARAKSAFAEMAQKISKAHTLSYLQTTEGPDLKTPMKARSFFKEPDLMRMELDGGTVLIMDGSQGKQLMLDPASKSALLLEGKAAAPPAEPKAGAGMIEYLRQLTEGDAKPAPEKVIGDVRARGYQVKKLGLEMTIWVDPATRLPLRIECTDRIQGKEFRSTITDFQIDPQIDDALFRMEPPAGYALRKEESKIIGMDAKTLLNPENAAADLLRIYAEKTGGTFPKRLDDPEEFRKTMPNQAKASAIPDSETLQMVQSLTRFMMATKALKDGYGYKSDGVKLGDADKILFWYRPDGATSYRALYGDLHAGDVSEDKLPEKPKP
jgi:outer membrane lipoprotein-sorting protein